MQILVIYSTLEGQTHKIVREISTHLQQSGHLATCFASRELLSTNFQDFSAATIAAPVHMGRFPEPLRRVVNAHSSELAQLPTALISVSLAAASSDPAVMLDIKRYSNKFSDETGWMPSMVHNAAGALCFSKYNFLKKWILKKIVAKETGPLDTSRDYEFTDWPKLFSFVDDFVSSINRVPDSRNDGADVH